MTKLDSQTDVLSKEEVGHFRTQGYLRVPDVYAPDEVAELAEDLDLLIDRWARSKAWTGPWREALLDADLAATIELRSLHDLRYYSAAWARATSNAKLAGVLRCLLGEAVELHHTTMHVKPPERGQPFPLHQDWPFYPHTDDRYVDVLLHLDDTSHDNGEISFLPGSHLGGPLQHVTVAGGRCAPPICRPTSTGSPTQRRCRHGAATSSASTSTPSTAHTSTRPPSRDGWCGWGTGTRTMLSSAARRWVGQGVMVVGTKPRQHGQEPYSAEA